MIQLIEREFGKLTSFYWAFTFAPSAVQLVSECRAIGQKRQWDEDLGGKCELLFIFLERIEVTPTRFHGVEKVLWFCGIWYHIFAEGYLLVSLLAALRWLLDKQGSMQWTSGVFCREAAGAVEVANCGDSCCRSWKKDQKEIEPIEWGKGPEYGPEKREHIGCKWCEIELSSLQQHCLMSL